MRRYLAFFMGIIASLASISVHAESKKVHLVTTVWPPYVMNETSTHRGYAYDVVKQSFEKMGYNVTIDVIPWEKGRELTIDGKADGLFPEYTSKDNLKYFVYSDPFLTGPLVLYEKMDGSPVPIAVSNNQKDFFDKMKSYRFGVVDGYVNVPAFDNNKNLKKFKVMDDKANLEQLYQGKVDLILIDRLNAQYILNNELPPQYRTVLKQVGPVLEQTHFYIVFSKKISNVEALRKDFNAGFKQLNDAKITHKIMAEYINEFVDRNIMPLRVSTKNN